MTAREPRAWRDPQVGDEIEIWWDREWRRGTVTRRDAEGMQVRVQRESVGTGGEVAVSERWYPWVAWEEEELAQWRWPSEVAS